MGAHEVSLLAEKLWATDWSESKLSSGTKLQRLPIPFQYIARPLHILMGLNGLDGERNKGGSWEIKGVERWRRSWG